MNQSFFGDKPINNDGTPADVQEALKHKYVALYFSAHWCPPCKAFTPMLAEFYNEAKAHNDQDIEIIFVSSDQDQHSFGEYFKTMPFKAIPFGDEIIKKLKTQNNVTGIPMLIIFKPDGTVVTRDGRAGVTNSGVAALKSWA